MLSARSESIAIFTLLETIFAHMFATGNAQMASSSHDSLSNSASHIRLLEVLEGNFGKHVVCEISTWPLHIAPPYCAISYTWGDPHSTVNITVNGQAMAVRRNCEYALQQAFTMKQKKLEYLWIDAICVDQNDLADRGHQVALMGAIYKRATQVLACVGPHTNDSEFLPIICKKKKRLLGGVDLRTLIECDCGFFWEETSPHYERRGLGWKLFLAVAPWVRIRLINALFAFLTRPYFSRVWVLQELRMGTNVSYCCGTDILPAKQLLVLSILVDAWCQKFVYSHTSRAVLDIVQFPIIGIQNEFRSTTRDAYDKARSSSRCLAYASGHIGDRPRHIQGTLTDMYAYHCTDIRDKLYGILSLVDWTHRPPPVPDYTKDAFQVAILALHIVETDDHEWLWRDFFWWTNHMLQIFHLSPICTSVLDALHRRSHDSQTSKGEPTRNPHWAATRLLPLSSQSTESPGLHCAPNPPPNAPVILYDNHTTPFAAAPPGTRPDDWYIQAPYDRPGIVDYTNFFSLGMIVRDASSDSTRQTIIGLVKRYDGERAIWFDEKLRGSGERCAVFWDRDDILLLSMFLREERGREEMCGYRVCGVGEGSWAVVGGGEGEGEFDY